MDIEYHETSDGVVKVSVEGVQFVDETNCYEMGMKTDKVTGFVTPYWPQLSNLTSGNYVNVFDFSQDISTENKNDMGELKALILARGDYVATYGDVEGLDKDTYNDTTGMSVMLTAEAQLDQMIHKMVTASTTCLHRMWQRAIHREPRRCRNYQYYGNTGRWHDTGDYFGYPDPGCG